MIDLGLDGFTDAEEVGRGGFGVVYKAVERDFGRTVAIKVLTIVDDETIRRFDRERLALGPVSNHPNIVQVFKSGLTLAGRPYLAMEFMNGGSLDDLVRRNGPLPWGVVMEMAVKLAGALETAHRAGITHRDLKPANVLLSEFGEPHLGDFGIASIEGGEATRSGVITASINYAPPEVLDGRRAGVAGDVYSFGATLFTLLTGRLPFARDTGAEDSIVALALRVASAPVPDLRALGAPPVLADIIERAMAKNPDQRYQTAEELGQAIQGAQRSLGLVATSMPVVHMAVPGQPPHDATVQYDPSSGPVALAASQSVAQIPAATPPTPRPPAPPGSEMASPAPPPAPGSDGPSRDNRRLLVIAGLVTLAIVGIVAGYLLGGDDGDQNLAAVDDTAGDTSETVTDDAGATVTDAEGSDTAGQETGTSNSDQTATADSGGEEATATAPETVPMEGDAAYEAAVDTEITGTWEQRRGMLNERQQLPAVVTDDGKIWMAGGLDAFGFSLTSVEFYDPLLETWSDCGCDLPVALNHHMATLWNGLPVVMGGWIGNDESIRAESSVGVYMLENRQWVELPPLLEPRIAGAAATVGGKIVITGGQNAEGELLTTTEVFDGTTWTRVADLPTAREHVAAASDGTHVYVVGGRLLPGGSASNVSALERYDPATDQWESLADMPTPRGGLAAVWAGGSLIALGGEGATEVLDDVERYDPATNTWTTLPPLDPGVHGLAAAAYRRTMYVIGGALDTSHVGSTDRLGAFPLGG